MSFSTAAAIFNSCNKAGSIRELTQYLDKYPNDYNALMLRATANGIVGKPQNELQDIEQAISVSNGVNREIAIARKIRALGNIGEYGAQAKRTVTKYLNKWRAWRELAVFFNGIGDKEEKIHCNLESLDLATKYNETRDPEFCWINYDLGNHWMEKGNVDTAKRYYEAAIKSSWNHTVSHIQLCRCNIALGNVPAARQHFQDAKSLNSNLVSQVFQTESFDEYFSRTGLQYTSVSSSPAGIQEGRAEGGAEGGATGGTNSGNNDGGNGGSNSDGKDGGNNDANATWKRLQKEALKRYNSHTYV